MSYDVKFRTLAATCPSLRWDVHHPDLWLECLTISKSPASERWPCPHYNSVYHFPDRCPFCGSRSSNFTSTDRQPADLRTSGPRNTQLPQSYHSNPGPPPYVCRDFNNRGKCIRPHCTFHHLCEVYTQSSSAPAHQGSPLSTLDIKGPRTPVRALILECGLRDHFC